MCINCFLMPKRKFKTIFPFFFLCANSSKAWREKNRNWEFIILAYTWLSIVLIKSFLQMKILGINYKFFLTKSTNSKRNKYKIEIFFLNWWFIGSVVKEYCTSVLEDTFWLTEVESIKDHSITIYDFTSVVRYTTIIIWCNKRASL